MFHSSPIYSAPILLASLLAPWFTTAVAAEKKPLVDEAGFALPTRTWVDSSGKTDFRACLHLIDDGNFVVLKKTDDTLMRLHFTQLSYGDQNYVLAKAKGSIRADAPPPPKPAATGPPEPTTPRGPAPPRSWSFQDGRPALTASYVGINDGRIELATAAAGAQVFVQPSELQSVDVLYLIRAMSGGASRTLAVPGLTNARLWTDHEHNVVFGSLVHLDLEGLVIRTPEGREIVLAIDQLGPYDQRLLKDNDREYARLREVVRLLKVSLEPPAPRTPLPSRSGSPSLSRTRQPRLAIEKFLLVGFEQLFIHGTREAAAADDRGGFERLANAMASELLKRHRDSVIEQIVQEGYPDLGNLEVTGLRIVIAAMLDGRLTLHNLEAEAAKELVKQALAGQDPKLARQVDLIEFVYDLSQTLKGDKQ